MKALENTIVKPSNKLLEPKCDYLKLHQTEKFVKLLCALKGCKFEVWYSFEGPTALKLHRSINLNHTITAHSQLKLKSIFG